MKNRQIRFIFVSMSLVVAILAALILTQYSKSVPLESKVESEVLSISPISNAAEVTNSIGSLPTVPSNTPSNMPNGGFSEGISNGTEASGVTVDELPYYPPDYMKLTPDDITPSELDGYFTDALFIGNSVTRDFSVYCTAQKQKDKNFLGGARFFSTYGFSAYVDLHGETKYFPKFKGEAMHSWEAVEKSGAKTVYFCLMGLTEIWKYPGGGAPEKAFESNRQVIEKIKERCPDVRIVVVSATYMVKSFNSTKHALNNNLASRFNALALEWCKENGYDFIDIATPFLEGDDMPDKYCRDPGEKGQGIHIRNEFYSAWVGMLRNYAYLKQRGAWKNPDEMRILTAH